MPQRNPAAPRQAREREEDRQRKLADLRARLHEEARALRTPGDWTRCLHLAARLLPGESFANILLIFSQRPGATLVRGYREWRAMGRQVSRGEEGIEVSPPPASRQSVRTGIRNRMGINRAGATLTRLLTSGTYPRPAGNPAHGPVMATTSPGGTATRCYRYR